MSPSTSNNTPLLFVTSSTASFPKTGVVRKQIRRQAMSKAASARRERGNYGKVNLGQVPNDVTDGLNGSKGAKAGTDEDEIDSSIKESSEVVAGHRGPSLNMHHRAGLVAGFKGYLKVFHQCRDLLKVSTYIPGSSYEVMRIELDFDPLDISALTGFHIGRPAVQTLKEKPETLKEVLKCRQWSYFNYLPKHYGESACLDDAVHCIAVRVRRYLKGSDVVPDRSVMHYYTTALRSLQSSLDDPARRLDPDVLCATEILAIYELLDFSSIRAWTRHIAGASALIKLRGPKRFRTDFEKALLLGLCASLYTEAMIAGEACFLDDEEWKSVISSAVLEYTTFSYCSENIISLWLRTVSIARLFKEVQDAVRRPEHTTPQLLTELIERVVKTRTGLNEWKQSYDSLCRAITLEAPEREAIDQFDRRMEALGIYLTNMVILNRLACSLRPMTGPSLESETQQLASDIFSLEQRTATDNPRAYMFLAFKLIIAQAAIDTEKEWRRAYTSESSGRAKPYSMVPWPVFENFIRLKGREIEEIVEEADDKPAKDTELNWQGHSLPERLVAPL